MLNARMWFYTEIKTGEVTTKLKLSDRDSFLFFKYLKKNKIK